MSRFKKLSKVRCQQPLVCWHGSVAFPILPIHIANLSRLSKCTLTIISILTGRLYRAKLRDSCNSVWIPSLITQLCGSRANLRDGSQICGISYLFHTNLRDLGGAKNRGYPQTICNRTKTARDIPTCLQLIGGSVNDVNRRFRHTLGKPVTKNSSCIASGSRHIGKCFKTKRTFGSWRKKTQ